MSNVHTLFYFAFCFLFFYRVFFGHSIIKIVRLAVTSPILYNCEILCVLFSNCTVIKTVISQATPITHNEHCKQLTKLFDQPQYITKLNEPSSTHGNVSLYLSQLK